MLTNILIFSSPAPVPFEYNHWNLCFLRLCFHLVLLQPKYSGSKFCYQLRISSLFYFHSFYNLTAISIARYSICQFSRWHISASHFLLAIPTVHATSHSQYTLIKHLQATLAPKWRKSASVCFRFTIFQAFPAHTISNIQTAFFHSFLSQPLSLFLHVQIHNMNKFTNQLYWNQTIICYRT